MIKELSKIADELSRDKGLSKEQLSALLQEIIVAIISKKCGEDCDMDINIDLEKGEIGILIPKKVVDIKKNQWLEIDIEDAKVLDINVRLGQKIMVPVTFESLGRQAAILAKQKLFESLRDTEKQMIYDEFQGRVGQIVTGVVLKSERDYAVINIGKTEAILPRRESIPGDFFNRSAYVRALLLDIRVVRGWPQLILSRTHPDFLKKLFEVEIPEVFEGIIEIKAVAREPGDRAKVAVYTTNSNIDPVGACIGIKGMRINAISNELKGERIDVLEWSDDMIKFVCNAISPAEVLQTNVFEEDNIVEIIVPDEKLSLAIGKKGQNVKLASKLLGWKFDILKESEYNDIKKSRIHEQEQEWKEFYELYNLENIEGLDEISIAKLIDKGIDDVEKLSTASIDELVVALNTTEGNALEIVNSAIDYLTTKLEDLED